MSRDRPGLSALLPLKISGRHYGDNLARLDLLFSSLAHHGSPPALTSSPFVLTLDPAKHFPVRGASTESLSEFRGPSRLEERFRTTSRLAAQQIYLLRRGSRGRRRAPRRAVPPNSVHDGGDRRARGGWGARGDWGE